MNSLQKGSILTLLKTDEMSSNYTNNYWFSYKDYLNSTADFTDFCCVGMCVFLENLNKYG